MSDLGVTSSRAKVAKLYFGRDLIPLQWVEKKSIAQKYILWTKKVGGNFCDF
jgi:hypothetical protein